MQNCMLTDEIHQLHTEKGMELHQLEDENQRLKGMVKDLQDTRRVGKKGKHISVSPHEECPTLHTLYRHTAADDLDGI